MKDKKKHLNKQKKKKKTFFYEKQKKGNAADLVSHYSSIRIDNCTSWSTTCRWC